jgi:MFS family permease
VSQGATSWTSNQTIAGLIVGGLALIAFIAVELRARNPLLELRVFRSVDFSFAIVVQWVGQFALFGALFLVPFFLQQVRGFGAFDTGLAMLPQAIAAAVVMPIGGMLFDRIGARPLVIVGLGMVAVATYLLAQVGVHTQATDLILPLSLTGAGMGLMMMPLNTHLINAAPRELVSRVTSLTNALQQVINSLSVAGLSTILTTQITSHLASATADAAAHPNGPRPTPAALANLQHTLMALGFDDTFRVMVVGAIVGAVMGLLLRRQPAVLLMKESTTEPEPVPSHSFIA